MSSRYVFLTLCTILFLTFAPMNSANAQDDTLQIRITQVDNSMFPQVTVYISVTNNDGEPVGVDPDQIQIWEDGVAVKPQLTFGAGESGSLTTLLVMDISGSMYNGGKLEAAKVAAHAYVTQMRPGDKAGLITFNTKVTYVQPITSDQDALDLAISDLAAKSDTAMYDALLKAADVLQLETGRKAIIVLTDGLDNRSKVTAEDVLSAIGPGGLSISTIGLGDPASFGTNFGVDEEGLKTLSERAGGIFGYAQDAISLQNLYESYGNAMRSEYAITYTSPSTLRDGVTRKLTVSLGTADRVETETQYNPGGVLPEVIGKSWLLFSTVLGGLVLLAILPGMISLLASRGGRKPRKKKSRIKLK